MVVNHCEQNVICQQWPRISSNADVSNQAFLKSGLDFYALSNQALTFSSFLQRVMK